MSYTETVGREALIRETALRLAIGAFDTLEEIEAAAKKFEAFLAGDSKVASDNDGWIEWGGGDCPVAADALVEVKLRNGTEWTGRDAEYRDYWDWSHDEIGGDIVAYRLVEKAA